jgi:hypothetical protein
VDDTTKVASSRTRARTQRRSRLCRRFVVMHTKRRACDIAAEVSEPSRHAHMPPGTVQTSAEQTVENFSAVLLSPRASDTRTLWPSRSLGSLPQRGKVGRARAHPAHPFLITDSKATVEEEVEVRSWGTRRRSRIGPSRDLDHADNAGRFAEGCSKRLAIRDLHRRRGPDR